MHFTWEKMKDFLYDMVRYLWILLVLAMVVVLVYWRIARMFGIENVFHLSGNQNESQISFVATSESTELTAHEVHSENREPLATGDHIEYREVQLDDETTVKIEVHNVNVKETKDMYLVGKMLRDEGLIDDIYDFVDRIKSLGLEKSVHGGIVKIEKGTPLDGIIDILTDDGLEKQNEKTP